MSGESYFDGRDRPLLAPPPTPLSDWVFDQNENLVNVATGALIAIALGGYGGPAATSVVRLTTLGPDRNLAEYPDFVSANGYFHDLARSLGAIRPMGWFHCSRCHKRQASDGWCIDCEKTLTA